MPFYAAKKAFVVAPLGIELNRQGPNLFSMSPNGVAGLPLVFCRHHTSLPHLTIYQEHLNQITLYQPVLFRSFTCTH